MFAPALMAAESTQPQAVQETKGHRKAPGEPGFKVFNAMLYANMPPVGERLPVVYEQHLFPEGRTNPDGTPTLEGIRGAVKNAVSQSGPPWYSSGSFAVLDVERWPLWPFASEASHVESVRRYAAVARKFKDESDYRICYYGILPSGGIAVATASRSNTARQQAWDLANDTLARGLLPHVDAICPSLYAFYDSADADLRHRYMDQWANFAKATIAQARRVSEGKPVYAFVWPQFHSGGTYKDFPFLPPEYWRLQLQTVRALADGIVLWGGWDFQRNAQLDWDPDAGWWHVFQEVMPTR